MKNVAVDSETYVDEIVVSGNRKRVKARARLRSHHIHLNDATTAAQVYRRLDANCRGQAVKALEPELTSKGNCSNLTTISARALENNNPDIQEVTPLERNRNHLLLPPYTQQASTAIRQRPLLQSTCYPVSTASLETGVMTALQPLLLLEAPSVEVKAWLNQAGVWTWKKKAREKSRRRSEGEVKEGGQNQSQYHSRYQSQL